MSLYDLIAAFLILIGGFSLGYVFGMTERKPHKPEQTED